MNIEGNRRGDLRGRKTLFSVGIRFPDKLPAHLEKFYFLVFVKNSKSEIPFPSPRNFALPHLKLIKVFWQTHSVFNH